MALRAVTSSERRSLERLMAAGGVRNLSPNTLAGYAADWRSFGAWCRSNKLQPFPATTEAVLCYLHHLVATGHKVSTARRHAAAIRHHYRRRGLASPVTQKSIDFLAAVKRLRGEQPNQKRPLTLEQLRQIVAPLTRTKRATRNKAILLVGWASALRRANLAALTVEDITIVEAGLVIAVRHEKQDRKGDGRIVAIPRGNDRELCPVIALEEWLKLRGNKPGPVFTRRYRGKVRRLLPKQIGVIVKNAVRSIGLDPRDYSGHSLRSGCITALLDAHVDALLVAAHSGHHSLEVLRTYHRRVNPFDGNVLKRVGF
jgi:integrase